MAVNIMHGKHPDLDVVDVLMEDHREALRTLREAMAATSEDLRDHRKIEDILARVEQADPCSNDYIKVAKELEGSVEDHVKFEEQLQFPQLRQLAAREQLVDLAGQVMKVKTTAPTHPHPRAPHDAASLKLVGPAMGLADRLRDTLRASTS
ncbi:hemerythrin HHE cation binding domain-containing protein [Tribonema minus]|uniref:Hemerythrin HHE cation binding domain-containing protein n=1 Tax=Tribonema minus TaxID=303371 RepID=A0A835YIC8_9STRA|nr:hemerythrin HHE cation binding domain-containing protein [Tribonema minus]